jgi:glutamyl-tRNA synthetase
VRTALYNFLLARQQNGTMILRIEDTDQNRYVPGAEEYIVNALRWAGITIDEGVGPGGPHAPYRQSERKDIYARYVKQLLDNGFAYYAFDTEEELDAMRKKLQTAGADQQQYGSATRLHMRNSLTLAPDEVTRLLNDGVPYVIRIKIPANEEVHLHDLIRGEVVVNSSQLDDKVLMKSDGMPTYHLANVVDDYLMQISHVIRGEEWLPSAPLHVLLYRFFGWEKQMPRFAHLPLLLKPDGNGKLSKRDADRMGFPIFPLNWTDPQTGERTTGFKEAGYLPEALINFLAFLGWNPGTEQEIFSMEQLIEAFSLARIGKAGARFDIQKAQWFNQQYLRAMPDEGLATWLIKQASENQSSCPTDRALRIVHLMKERITFPRDLWEQGKFFFQAPRSFDATVVAKKWNGEAVQLLAAYRDELQKQTAPSAAEYKTLYEQTATAQGIKPGQVLQALRLAITGESSGPDLMMTMEILGKEETVQRLTYALEHITK